MNERAFLLLALASCSGAMSDPGEPGFDGGSDGGADTADPDPPDPDPATLADPTHCFAQHTDLEELRFINNNVANDHGGVVAVAVAPSGQIAVGSSDGDIKLWDAPAGYGLLDPAAGGNQPDQPVAALAFDPMERWVAAAGATGNLFLWDVVRREPGASLSLGDTLRSVAVSDDGSHIVGVNDTARGHTRVWPTEDTVIGGAIDSSVEEAFAVAFIPHTDRFVVVGETDGLAGIAIHEANGAQVVGFTLGDTAQLADHAAHAVAASAAGGEVIVAGSGFVAKIAWEAVSDDAVLDAGDEGYLFNETTGHDVVSLAFTDIGEHFATFALDGGLRVWELATLIELTRNRLADGVALDAMHEGERFVVGGSDGYLRIYGCAESD